MASGSMLSAGDLDQRIRIRPWSDVASPGWGLAQQFGDGFTTWAKREPMRALLMRDGMQTDEQPTDLFFVRQREGTRPHEVTVAHVVEYRSKRYRVLGAIDWQGMEFTRIAAKDLGPVA